MTTANNEYMKSKVISGVLPFEIIPTQLRKEKVWIQSFIHWISTTRLVNSGFLWGHHPDRDDVYLLARKYPKIITVTVHTTTSRILNVSYILSTSILLVGLNDRLKYIKNYSISYKVWPQNIYIFFYRARNPILFTNNPIHLS